MRSKNITIFLGLIVCLFTIGCEKESFQPPTDEEILGKVVKPEIVDEYIYPIKPGTPEWAELTSHDEMFLACEIPKSILKSISTWGLVETCFNYPLAGDFVFQNFKANYINCLTREFNGLIELFSRKDAPIILLYYYRYYEISQDPNFINREYKELIIGCDLSMSKLNQRQLIYIVSLALEKANEHSVLYGDSYFPSFSHYIMANAMKHAGFNPFIDYCASNFNKKEELKNEYQYWGFTAKTEKIEEYAKVFVSNP